MASEQKVQSHTLMLCLKLEPGVLNNKEIWKRLENMALKVMDFQAGNLTEVPVGNSSDHDKLIIFPGNDGSHGTMRVYGSGLVTVDSQKRMTKEYKSFEDYPYNMEYIRQLENDIRQDFKDVLLEMNCLYTPIKRGQAVWQYALSADERLLEMDYDELIFEKRSKFQMIRIVHSREFGNVLFLDGDSMLGESDMIYTRTLLCDGRESFKDKEILILGGGDGGLLYELLKENPKMVTMAEIDEEVIKGCRQHMRSVCGDAMDSFKGPNHQILIADCVKVLHESIKNGQLYDYVINDLTEFPVEKAIQGFGYDMETTSLMTELSLKALKPKGKVLARGNCWGAYEYRKRVEGELRQLNCDFNRRDVFVPSFQETYCLYEIWKLDDFKS